MTFDLNQQEVDLILNLIAYEGVAAYKNGNSQAFALQYQPIIEKLDPKGWSAAQTEAAAQETRNAAN